MYLRKVGQKGIRWDDPIPKEDEIWWGNWMELIKRQLKYIKVPRHVYPNESHITSRELHVFNDASTEAYASIIYMRVIYNYGEARCNIIISKSKLAPKKTIPIAKLELNAAVLGVRLAFSISPAFSRKIDKRVFWTDNSCVRNWVRATSSLYKPYVANRIGEIQMLTSINEWRYTPGELNPSDAATRSTLDKFELPDSWLKGPQFLYENESAWPQDVPWLVPSEELRKELSHSYQASFEENWDEVNFDPKNIASYTTLNDHLVKLIKQSQKDCFSDDITRLKAKKNVKSKSSLRELNPFLDANDLLRVNSRVGRIELPFENRFPIILPKKHPLKV